jgi:hypothetical protein
MAEDVSRLEERPTTEEPALVPDRSERARRSSYRFRFGLVYILLAVVAGAAVGSFVVLALQPAPDEEAAWSTWRPQGRVNAYPAAIAEHVGQRYRLPSGKQLVGVLAGPAEVQELPLRGVMIQHSASNPTKEDDLETIEIGNGVMYNLCGTGARCSISEGKPSANRLRLLRREALELALYTFKYVEDIDSVIALMPTNLGSPETPDDDTASVLFLQKKDFRRQLQAPLQQTLPGRPGTTLDAVKGQLVDGLTRQRQYLFDIQPTQDLGAVMLLLPIPNE